MGKYGEYVKRSLILGGSSSAAPPTSGFSPSAIGLNTDEDRSAAIARMRSVLSGETAAASGSPFSSSAAVASSSPGPRLAEEGLPTLGRPREGSLDARLYPHARHRSGEDGPPKDDAEKLQRMRGVLGTQLSFRGPTASAGAFAGKREALTATSPPADERIPFRERVVQGTEIQKEIAAAEVALFLPDPFAAPRPDAAR